MNKYLILVLLFIIVLFSGCVEKVEVVPTKIPENARVVTSAQDTDLRLIETGIKTFENAVQPVETEVSIFVNPNKKYQTFLGIGGAITDASAEVFATLPDEQKEKFLKSYYNVDVGIGYTLARTSIHSCDFSSGSFTYVTDEDKKLGTFNIEHDLEYRIPLIKKAIEYAGGNLTFYASPWSPPPFMKSNNHMLQGGKLLPEYYDSWALYYTKFIKEYEKLGIPVWGITVQNEPMATQTWESCIYTAEEERDFLKNHLGPTMKREGLGDKNIVVWDHNRDLIVNRANTILDDPEAAKYAWGVGFHWYESWAGGREMYENIGIVQNNYPDKKLLFTEGCAESFRPDGYESWKNAERYGRSMINDFNYGAVGWTDWNILLDQRGGPNHVGNFCFAPVHANTETGELIYTPSYYYIGHFSKYIRPGAKMVSTASSRSHLLATTFENTDGSIVTVIMNQSDIEIEYKLYFNKKRVTETLKPHSMQTLIY